MASKKNSGAIRLLPAAHFPSRAELEKLADLAKIEPSRRAHYFANINDIIYDSRWLDEMYGGGQATNRAVSQRLESLAKLAKKLHHEFSDLVNAGESEENPTVAIAHDFVSFSVTPPNERPRQNSRMHDFLDCLSDISAGLGKARDDAKRAHSKKGRPAGAVGNAAIVHIIEQLHLSARMNGGKLTNFRRRDGQWSGTFLEAVDTLRAYFPASFPRAGLGRKISQVRARLIKTGTRSRPKRD